MIISFFDVYIVILYLFEASHCDNNSCSKEAKTLYIYSESRGSAWEKLLLHEYFAQKSRDVASMLVQRRRWKINIIPTLVHIANLLFDVFAVWSRKSAKLKL